MIIKHPYLHLSSFSFKNKASPNDSFPSFKSWRHNLSLANFRNNYKNSIIVKILHELVLSYKNRAQIVDRRLRRMLRAMAISFFENLTSCPVDRMLNFGQKKNNRTRVRAQVRVQARVRARVQVGDWPKIKTDNRKWINWR